MAKTYYPAENRAGRHLSDRHRAMQITSDILLERAPGIRTLRPMAHAVHKFDGDESSQEFRISQKVVLRPGDRFRASGGPYYEINGADGTITRARMRDPNPFVYLGWFAKDGRTYLKARSPEGFTVLNLSPSHRHPDLPSLVKAPYTKIRKIRQTRRERALSQPPKVPSESAISKKLAVRPIESEGQVL